MQYTISDMAKYVKNLIPANIPDIYSIKPMFHYIAEESVICEGVLAFRDLLYVVCDSLIKNNNLYDKKRKNSDTNTSHVSLPVSYPFLNNVKSILFTIGFHGELCEGNSIFISEIQELTSVISAEGRQMKAQISGPKLLKALNFLVSCGFKITGFDLEKGKIDKTKKTELLVTYPDNPKTLIGLKVMAIAQRKLYTPGNHDIFLRCDYRVIKNEETETLLILKDFLMPLSQEVQNFVFKLHNHYIDAGLTCRINVFYLGVRFIYFYKRKEVFTFSATMESGYRILIKSQKNHLYSDVIRSFPQSLQKVINRGYGCNKKLFAEPCQKGCHGYSFPLDSTVLDISSYIKEWLNNEVYFLGNKKRIM